MYNSEKKKVNEQFGRKINEDVNGNRKLFWKEVSNGKGAMGESCSRIKDGNIFTICLFSMGAILNLSIFVYSIR